MKRSPLQEMLDELIDRDEIQKVVVTAEELKAIDMQAFHAFVLVDALKVLIASVGDKADSLFHYTMENVVMEMPLDKAENADRLALPMVTQGQCVQMMANARSIINNLMQYIVMPVVHKHADESFQAEKGGVN